MVISPRAAASGGPARVRRCVVPSLALAAAGALLAGCGGGPAGGGGKISDGKVVLAVLNDQSGVYADVSGRGGVEAVRMAGADYKAKYGDKAVADTIEVDFPPPRRTDLKDSPEFSRIAHRIRVSLEHNR